MDGWREGGREGGLVGGREGRREGGREGGKLALGSTAVLKLCFVQPGLLSKYCSLFPPSLLSSLFPSSLPPSPPIFKVSHGAIQVRGSFLPLTLKVNCLDVGTVAFKARAISLKDTSCHQGGIVKRGR